MGQPVGRETQSFPFSVLSKGWNRIRRMLRGFQDPRYRVNQIGPGAMLGTAILEGNVLLDEHIRLIGDIRIGKYTTVGRFTIMQGEINVGRYTQIGPNVGIYADNHGVDYITTYNNRKLFGGRLKELSPKARVEIGHDVWIGIGAVILPGVKIGNGAVIGAGAIVTKDVPDYSIAVGNPARVIRKRLDDEMIKLLTKWAWWQFEPAELKKYEPLFKINLNADQQAAAQLSAYLSDAEGRS